MEDPCAVGLLHVKEQEVPMAATMAHHWQYTSAKAPWFPSVIHQLESQGVIRKTHKVFF